MSIITAKPALEYTIFTPQGGSPFILDQASGRFVLSEEGLGMPPIEYITERGPFQHGETVRAYFLRPRIISLRVRNNFCSRTEFWRGRASLLDVLRPNRGVNGTLRRILSDGTVRDITCIIQDGPNFNPRRTDAWDEWAFDEMLRFVCFNPVWYNPTLQTTTWIQAICGEFPYDFPISLVCPGLIFPITFPIVFDVFGGEDIITVDYLGNWEEYPSFVITGPFQSIKITNLTTNEVIQLLYTINEGQSVNIDLSYGIKTIALNDGTNLLAYLTPESDLATFHLAPGGNQIELVGYGSGTNSSVVMNYYNRFIGI